MTAKHDLSQAPYGEAYAEMWRLAREADPEEACGIVSLHTWRVFPVGNVSHTPDTAYAGDPVDMIRAVRACAGEPFAVYHSHVSAKPVPSMLDLDGAFYPHQIIMSLKTGELVSYFVNDGHWTVEGTIIMEENR